MMDFINILKEMSHRMMIEIWEVYDRYYDRLSPKEFGKKVDMASAQAAREYLEEEHLSFTVISEEGFENYKGGGTPILVVDPIDGTSNFSRNIPFSCISLALAWDNNMNSIRYGLVRDIFRDDVYWAVYGEGAYLNGKRIKVSKVKSTFEAHISVNINRAVIGKYSGLNILPHSSYARHFGSAALEGCFVASGRLDAFIDVRGVLRVFDIAAAQLIVREAGGKIYLTQFGKNRVLLNRIGGVSVVFTSTHYLMERISDLLGL
jgi:myo-inositol-1(or 4)-monophosphatase